MNAIWGAELNYAPDYWPLWLIYAGVVILLMIVGLVAHALLRRMLAPKTATGEEHRDYLYSLAVRRWHWGNALLFGSAAGKRVVWSLFDRAGGAHGAGTHLVWLCITGLLGGFRADKCHYRQRLPLSGEM